MPFRRETTYEVSAVHRHQRAERRHGRNLVERHGNQPHPHLQYEDAPHGLVNPCLVDVAARHSGAQSLHHRTHLVRCPPADQQVIARENRQHTSFRHVIASGNAIHLQRVGDDNAVKTELIAQSRLVRATEGYRWRWPEGTQALEQLLWPIICSAIDLLTSPEVRRVKVCPGLGDCGWLFLDTSKSGRRRWCSMESCGSRSKMRRYYARTHARPVG